MSSICGTNSSSSSLLSTELSNQAIVYVNVGGQVFTTTKRTLRKSGLFLKLFRENKTQTETETETTDREPTVPTQTEGVYLCHSNYYFVDRSPLLFDDVLHFLRNMPASSAETFLHRYYGASPLSLSRRSSFSLNSNASDCAAISLSRSRDLLKLQDEAVFYHIPTLIEGIQDRLDDESKELHLATNMANMASCKEIVHDHDGDVDTHSVTLQSRPQYSTNSISNSNLVTTHTSRPSPLVLNPIAPLSSSSRRITERPDVSWWDQSGPLHGLRRIEGTRIAFATAMDNWVDKHCQFEAPRGFKWATQSMYLSEYHAHRATLSAYKQWIHFGVGAWDNYRWKYARKVAFIFADTFRSQRFVHSGMEVCDINHVKSIFGLVAESPLMDYDDDKGIVEGFAGLVLLADEEWHPEREQNQNDSTLEHPEIETQQIEIETETETEQKDELLLTLPEDICPKMSTDEEEEESGDEKKDDEVDVEVEVDDMKRVVMVIDDDAASASTWSSVEETEEQLKGVILELSTEKPDFSISKTKSNNSSSNNHTLKVSSGQGEQVLAAVNSKKVLSPAAVPYPAPGAPLLANPFAEYTKEQRARLTKNNLEKHTRIESIKHRTQQQQQQQTQTQTQTKQVMDMNQLRGKVKVKEVGLPMKHVKHVGMLPASSHQVLPVRSPKVTVSSPVHAMSPKSMTRFTHKYATAVQQQQQQQQQQQGVQVGSPTFFQHNAYHGRGHGHPVPHGGHAHSPMRMIPRHGHTQMQFPVPPHNAHNAHGHGHRLMYQTPPMMPVANTHSFAPPPLGAHLSVNSLPNHQ